MSWSFLLQQKFLINLRRRRLKNKLKGFKHDLLNKQSENKTAEISKTDLHNLQMNKERELYKINHSGQESPKMSETPDNSFFNQERVKKCKQKHLKNRLKTLITAKGMTESCFYNSLDISRQHWYFLSWGLWETPIHLKVKIARALDTDSSAIWVMEEKNG